MLAKDIRTFERQNLVALARVRPKGWHWWEIDTELAEMRGKLEYPEEQIYAETFAKLKQMASNDFDEFEISGTKHGLFLKAKLRKAERQYGFFARKYAKKFGGDYIPDTRRLVPPTLRLTPKFNVYDSSEVSPEPKTLFSTIKERPRSPVLVYRGHDQDFGQEPQVTGQ